MATAMVDEGLLIRTPDGTYRLGLVLWGLALKTGIDDPVQLMQTYDVTTTGI